jgi:hypothetical protein
MRRGRSVGVQLRMVVPVVSLAPLLVAALTWLSAPAATMDARPSPSQGPGGPILVIADSADPFGRYYAEILRAEGLNEFSVADQHALTRKVLDRHSVVVLAPRTLGAREVSVLASWVRAGGGLIAMQPDRRLARVLGLRAGSGPLADGYLRIDTRRPPGAGLTGETMQFHGRARTYALAGAREIARLYFTANTPSPYPAVTLRSVGSGQAVAFAYDLARSVVYTRQGNPAWAGDERDGRPPIRSDDLFFGAKRGDEQADWVDLDKIAIPQADEQQRLLANLITRMSPPLPRFWYLPRGLAAAVVMTGDDHGIGGTVGQFETFEADSPPGCSVADWQCVRATSYIYPETPIPDEEVSAYQSAGFEIALHTSTDCEDTDSHALGGRMTDELRSLRSEHPVVAKSRTNRTHCIAWSDWAGEPKAEVAHGVHLDTNYYFWPGPWVRNRPGMFTGSGMPMRFADLDGSPIDVYQAATQITDESGMDVRKHIRALLDGALGQKGYYGVFTANMHTDFPDHPGAKAIVAEAQRRGVPVISAAQLLEWLDGRNGSSFAGVRFRDGKLQFRVLAAPGSHGLQAMLPADGLRGLTRDGRGVSLSLRTVKGIRYGTFAAQGGAYVASYARP